MKRLLVMCVLLAGCFGDEPKAEEPEEPVAPSPSPPGQPAPAEPGTDPTPMLLDFEYTDCLGFHATILVPMAEAEEEVPEGYQVLDVDGRGRAELRWLDCDWFRTAAAEVNDTVYGHVAIELDDGRWYRTHMLVKDDIMEILWDAAGYVLVVGESAHDLAQVALPGASVGRYTASFEPWAADMVTAVGADTQGDRTYVTEVDRGTLVWTCTEEALGFGGQGTLTGIGAGEVESMRYVANATYLDNQLWLHPPAS